MDILELRERIAALPPLEPAPRFTWQFRRQQLRNKIMSDDPTGFLRWPIVKESLFTGDSPYIREELAAIGNGTNAWRDVLRSPDFGNPDRGSLGHTDGTFVNQVYALHQYEANRRGEFISNYNTIVEFGGGYGAMAYILHHGMWASEHYIIQDFPELLLLQEYYLWNVGARGIQFGGEVNHHISLYIALFSLSEVEPDKRQIPDADHYLIGYQSFWDGWNNEQWFADFAASRPELDWRDFPNPCFSGHRYLTA